MKSGAMALVDGDFDEIDTSDFPVTEQQGGEELSATIDDVKIDEDLGGFQVLTGTAAKEEPVEVENYSIGSDGEIASETDESSVTTNVAEFACVPGEFVVTEDSNAEFVYELIEYATDAEVNPVSFDLGAFADAHSDAQYWMSGFYGHPGPANKGAAFGRNIVEDENIGEIVRDSEIDRLGLGQFEYENQSLKLLVTESGYVDVYKPEPDRFNTILFVKFLDDVLRDFAVV